MTARIIDASSHDEKIKLFECLVAAEEERRTHEIERIEISLQDFEKSYFGPSVGAIRRACNAVTMAHLKVGGDLLDYGCGSFWWKDDYWPQYDQVYAVEVTRRALEDIGGRYPHARLVYTRNGLIDPKALAGKKFDVVMSSSVVGYILPIQAKYHLQSCYDLLKPGGQLMLTRVRAFNAYSFIRANRLALESDTSFSYGYTVAELRSELERLGFKDIRYHHQGVRLPIPWRLNQALYRVLPAFMTSILPGILPFLKIHHLLIATK